MPAPRQPAPDSLGPAGQSVWASVTSKYKLRADELFTLEDACAASDMIAELRASWVEEGKPLHTKGSMGQKVIHPLIGEIRAQQSLRNSLWRQLRLPDDASAAPDASGAARKAATSRWDRGA